MKLSFIQLILAKKCREQPLESKTNLGADLIGFGLPLLETLFLFEGKWLAYLSHFQFFWIEINDLVDLCPDLSFGFGPVHTSIAQSSWAENWVRSSLEHKIRQRPKI